MTLHFDVQGEGEPLVFIHGWGLNRRVWTPIADTFSKHNQVITIDLPGFGKSAITDTNYHLSTITDQVADIVGPESIVIGWSLGGLVALNLAISRPDIIKKIIAVSTSAQFVQSDGWPDAIKKNVFDEFTTALTDDYRKTIQRFLAVQSIGSERARDEIRVLTKNLFIDGEPQQEALVGGLEIFKSTRLQQQLDKISCPTLFISGERDTLSPLASNKASCELIHDCELVTIPGAGHAPFISHPNVFIKQVSDFINE